MAEPIAQLLRLLKTGEPEARCAAAICLGRLRPVEARVVRALTKATEAADGATRPYMLDALAATKAPEVIDVVLPFLEMRGSPSDQAVKIIWKLGKKALPKIAERHLDVRGWRTGAYLKAVAGIPAKEAVRMVFERLPDLGWEEARATSLFLRENYANYPASVRNYLTAELRRTLASPDGEASANSVTTALKLIHVLGQSVDPAIIMPFTARGRPGSVRRHAYQALATILPAADEVLRLREEIVGAVEESNIDDVVSPALDVLAAWNEPPLSADELKRISRSRHAIVVEWALQEMLARRDPATAEEIKRLVRSERSHLRAAAIGALVDMADGGKAMLDAFIAEKDENVRCEIAASLVSAGDGIARTRLRRLAKEYVRDVIGGRAADRALVTLLGTVDRSGFNRMLGTASRMLIGSGHPEKVLDLLQPVVRSRFATEETRVVLALANLELAGDRLDDRDPHFKRAVDLFAPLARTQGYDLAARLNAEPALTDARRAAVVKNLLARGPEEKKVADLLGRRADAG